MFDKSTPPARGSKWRRVTAEEQARAEVTGRRLCLDTQVLEAGGALPVRVRRSRAAPRPLVPPDSGEIAGMWAFLSIHGREIAPLLGRVGSEVQQLRLARAYRDIKWGVPGANGRWISLLRELHL